MTQWFDQIKSHDPMIWFDMIWYDVNLKILTILQLHIEIDFRQLHLWVCFFSTWTLKMQNILSSSSNNDVIQGQDNN